MTWVNARGEEILTYDKFDLLPLFIQASAHKLVHLSDLIYRREFTLELSLVGEFDTDSGLQFRGRVNPMFFCKL